MFCIPGTISAVTLLADQSNGMCKGNDMCIHGFGKGLAERELDGAHLVHKVLQRVCFQPICALEYIKKEVRKRQKGG